MKLVIGICLAGVAGFLLAACGDNYKHHQQEVDATFNYCGNGTLDPGEDCDDGDQVRDAVCDTDCHFTCGNGAVDDNLGELCDTAIAAGRPGACPSACDDGIACTADVLSGSGCQAECTTSPITQPANNDGCCPTGANNLNDNDCSPTCGNGVVESGETCDTGITVGAGACPTAPSCNDGMACTTDALMSGGTCQAVCTNTPITQPANNDGCCPAGANPGNDNDCALGCGNGVVDPGETCDTAITAGAGRCPTTCSDGMSCTRDVLVNGGTCTAACTFPAIVTCANGDGCCPAGCNANNDNSCTPRCGNGVVEGTEACDDGNTNNNDGCTNVCTIPVVAFRFSDLDLRDPHVWVNAIGCRDLTDNGFFTFAGVNPAINTALTTDGNNDGFLDLAPVMVFRMFNQTAATQPMQIYFANCSAPVGTTTCRPGVQAPIAATATNMAAGQCLTFLPNTVRPYAPAITSTNAPCFVTNPVTVTISLSGIPITLHDARLAATYVGNPAATLTNGLLMGFISEADANATIIPASFPLVGNMPLSVLLPGGTGNCNGGNDKDMDNGVVGWWFYLNFPAVRAPWSDN